ncbi:lytic transglycosylase domain-containing protein [Kineosporia succinea]|uniref:Transglycosylase SLT domain-containing protein n=1 Tax=Kineosporia succinea TaxID=84632 RepID=A0ABT9P9A0_9ACTN|nr:lytic transglycosylase domain-containing protein [Kineosporia succinea]MDP9828605.1 hypothetical protein [Kineosporia succinea]
MPRNPPTPTRTLVPVPLLRAAGLAAVLLAAVLSGPAASAAAAPRSSPPRAGAADDAQARASRAQERVEKLLEQYEQAEKAVSTQLSRVTRAFATADAAGDDAERFARLELAAEKQRQRDIRAVYASGGAAGLTATLLDADSPSDVLWRQSTNTRLMKNLLDSDHETLSSARLTSNRADAAAARADAAAAEQAAAMTELKTDAQQAGTALTRARVTLARLDRTARKARAAQQARERLAQAQSRAQADRRSATGTVTALGIPADYLAAYRSAAGTCTGLRWTLLAAVGQVESGHGRNVGPSSAGAQGPMQFMPATFAAYGVDGDLDGVTDVWDPQDAIFSAANYLCASGIRDGKGDRTALFAYNRADWYVDLVLTTERAIIARPA